VFKLPSVIFNKLSEDEKTSYTANVKLFKETQKLFNCRNFDNKIWKSFSSEIKTAINLRADFFKTQNLSIVYSNKKFFFNNQKQVTPSNFFFFFNLENTSFFL
jgi:hypothetical protein